MQITHPHNVLKKREKVNMSDDLVKRLRELDRLHSYADKCEAASRIEKLEAALDGAYTERNRLVAFLARIYPSGVKRTAIPGWDEAWHNCAYINLPVGQASWHYHDSEAHLFAHLPPYDGEWDGHTTEEKYERLFLAASHSKQTDELFADYMKFADVMIIQTNNQNARIEKLEAALRGVIAIADRDCPEFRFARKALEGKDD
jgi:hypothetical protein